MAAARALHVAATVSAAADAMGQRNSLFLSARGSAMAKRIRLLSSPHIGQAAR